MALLRGTEQIWNAATVTGAPDNSSEAFVGAGSNVGVYIKNSGANSATIKLQVGFPSGGKLSAGRNTDPTDWFDYEKAGGAVLSVTVAAGALVAIDLSPFSPPYLRLVCTAAAGGTTLSAWATSFGTD